MSRLRKSWMAGWPDLLRGFGRWWLRECLALFPERIARWLMGGGRVALAVAREDDRISLHLLDDNRHIIASQRLDDAYDVPARIADFLASPISSARTASRTIRRSAFGCRARASSAVG
jgi:hypothetical protein